MLLLYLKLSYRKFYNHTPNTQTDCYSLRFPCNSFVTSLNRLAIKEKQSLLRSVHVLPGSLSISPKWIP